MQIQRLAIGPIVALSFALGALACGDDDGGSGTEDADVGDAGSDVGGDTGLTDTLDDAEEDASDDASDVADDAMDADTGGVDAVDAGDADVGPVEPELAVVHAHTRDGSAVWVQLDRDVEPSTAGAAQWSFVGSGGGAQGAASADVIGDSVELVPDAPLDAGQTWKVSVGDVRGVDGARLAEVPTEVDLHGTAVLNLVWHQHQPSYLDPGKDELQGPWVRKHATKDYFDMTAIVAGYPDIHFNVNLTSSLLSQLEIYIDRLGPFVDLDANTIDDEAFLAAWGGHTDPWVDLLLGDTPAPEAATEEQLGRFYADVWSTRSIAEPLRAFFPEYEALVLQSPASYTQLDLLHLKLWFELAWMDPDFLVGPVEVFANPEGGEPVVIDLSDVVVRAEDGTFTLDPYYTDAGAGAAELLERGEALANRLVVENYKAMKGTFEVHKALAFDGGAGQVEVLTTPFFHPILPLLFDSDLASEAQPADPMPNPAFAYPEDVETQIAMAVAYYTSRFGAPPRGMWPSEGAVAEEIVPALRGQGIDWIATDRGVLEKSLPGADHLQAYKVDVDTSPGDGGDTDDEMMIVFRDTDLSDKVGFAYQSNPAADNAADFTSAVLSHAPLYGGAPKLMSVILDGENAWEWYAQDHDAKAFHHALYAALSEAFARGSIVTVTGSEYIDGNAARGGGPHAITELEEVEDLFPGSWIGGRLDTWIGETEENLGWVYLRTAREAIEAAKATLAGTLPVPDDLLTPPDAGDPAALAWWSAWRAMYSAEGSDWFWWYGADQTAAGGDDSPFDAIFRAQLVAMYGFMNEALALEGFDPVEVPGFPPILQPEPTKLTGAFATPPVIDGLFVPDDSEWTPPAGVLFDNDTAGAIDDPDDDIARVLFGYSNAGSGSVFVAVEFNEDLSDKLESDYRVALYTSHGNIVEGEGGKEVVSDPFNTETEEGLPADLLAGGAARQILVDFSGTAAGVKLAYADGEGGWVDQGAHTITVGGPVAGGSLLELQIPLDALGLAKGDPFEFLVVAAEGLAAVDRAPNIGSTVVFADPTKLVTVTFELDVTGAQVPIDEYVTILDPPPPAGTGTPSIVGNQPEFANWTPNSVFMADDGQGGDTASGDGLWSIQFTFPPGTSLQYKYTIGAPGQSWGGTEEYPLTNRGLTVPADGTQKIRVRDVFADRPGASGTMAALTTVTPED
jgi:alpha-amylase/alpha-mannosidase (GH57 family)